MTSHPPTPPTNEPVDKLRAILTCQCWFNDTCDGKAYNPKTEEYENCSCVEAIAGIQQLVAISNLEARLVELDLLEQAINTGWNMNKHKLYRLEQLTAQLEALRGKKWYQ